jgi:hypothetical protein
MPTAVVTSLVKKIQQLSPREQQELRTALGTLLFLAFRIPLEHTE